MADDEQPPSGTAVATRDERQKVLPAFDIDRTLEEITEPLMERYGEGQAYIQWLEQELERTCRGVESMQAALHGLGVAGIPAPRQDGKTKPPKRKPQQPAVRRTSDGGTATGFGVSLEVAAQAADAIKALVAKRQAAGEGPYFTQKQFYRDPDLDWDQSKGSSTVRYLRHIGFLRRAGRHPETKAELWAIMDADAMDKVLAASDATVREQEQAQAGDGSAIDLSVAYLQEHGHVQGWSSLAEAIGVPKGTMDGVKVRLLDAGLIEIEQHGRRKPHTIIWKGNNGDAAE